MKKLVNKFIINIAVILIGVMVCSLFLNSNFIGRYVIYQEKEALNTVCDRMIQGTATLDKTIEEIEQTEDVVIASVSNSKDNQRLNEQLRKEFLDKGIGLEQYWLWEQDQQETQEKGRKMRIYYQEKLHYSLLVEYLYLDGDFIAVAKMIPSVEQTIQLVNQVTTVVFLVAAVIMILLLIVLVRRITAPLAMIGAAAKSIADMKFQTLEIHTHDELELLADDINHMSYKLEKAHLELEHKNRQMEALLANVSHDLKTPVSLIKAYASGMKDGMDDGTFLDTIIQQNNRMEVLIERLLNLVKFQHTEEVKESIRVSELLSELIDDYQIRAAERDLVFQCEIETGIVLVGNYEAVYSIFSNLLSNAVKYSYGGLIEVSFLKKDSDYIFQIRNQIEDAAIIEKERIWDPFYVAEESRNKEMSGTGLGLSIVKEAAKQQGYEYECTIMEQEIMFTIIFKI